MIFLNTAFLTFFDAFFKTKTYQKKCEIDRYVENALKKSAKNAPLKNRSKKDAKNKKSIKKRNQKQRKKRLKKSGKNRRGTEKIFLKPLKKTQKNAHEKGLKALF